MVKLSVSKTFCSFSKTLLSVIWLRLVLAKQMLKEGKGFAKGRIYPFHRQKGYKTRRDAQFVRLVVFADKTVFINI